MNDLNSIQDHTKLILICIRLVGN